jgi:hypothetical protein
MINILEHLSRSPLILLLVMIVLLLALSLLIANLTVAEANGQTGLCGFPLCQPVLGVGHPNP